MNVFNLIKQPIQQQLQYQYVTALFDIVARSLVGASHVDEKIQAEISQFPVGFRFAMSVFSSKIGFCLEVDKQRHLRLVEWKVNRPVDVNIRFKHLRYAFLVLSFQESTARAFANDRMLVDGDLSSAIRLVRCLNQLEAVILPKVVAQLAVKQYPQDLTLGEKLQLASQIYRKVALSYFK